MGNKRHGLWQFHRALNSRGEIIEWWKNENIENAIRRVEHVTSYFMGGAHIVSPWRKMDVVIRCANRYIRRYSLPNNAKTWNEVCDRILNRISAKSQTVNAVMCGPTCCRKYTKIIFKDELSMPKPVRYFYEIKSRLERRLQFCRETQRKYMTKKGQYDRSSFNG